MLYNLKMNFNFKYGDKMQKSTYRTKQRTLIEKCIKSFNGNHFTIDRLCTVLAQNGESVGRTTVYRCVEKLANDGVLQKYVQSAGESACYQYVSDSGHCHEHFHLKCEKCGDLIHMDCREMSVVGEHIKSHHGFEINPLKTVIYGVCEDCATK